MPRDELALFRRNATKARRLLFDLVSAHLTTQSGPSETGHTHFQLAKTGRDLYNGFLPRRGVAREVRDWLEGLTKDGQVESLRIVCDRSPWLVPWNLIYAGEPREEDFSCCDNQRLCAAHEAFWGVRYNLCGGMRVNPLQLMPLPENPYALFVIDPSVHASLAGLPVSGQKDLDQQSLLDRFLEMAQRAWSQLWIARNRPELESKLAIRRPDLMYWLCHSDPKALYLGNELITLDDLRNLLAEFTQVGQTTGLVILNACRTAVHARGLGSFLRVFHRAGYCGLI
jgi:hypothetical protein